MVFLVQTPPAVVAPARAYEVPFALEGALIVVEGKVNGQPARLLLDTGAGTGVYTPRSAEKLQLKSKGNIVVAGGGEKLVPAKLTSAQISLGGAVQENQLGVILDLPAGTKTEFDGIVGYPFLKNYIVQLDYAAKRLRLLPASGFTPPPGAQMLPMTIRMNIPEIPARIDGLAGNVRVDTGYSGSLTFTTPTVAKNTLADKYPKKVETVLGKGMGGVAVGDMVRIGALELGDFKIPGVLTGLSRDKSGALADTETIALLGGEVLSRFTVTLDYPGKRLFLTKNADFEKPFLFWRAGLSGSMEGDAYQLLTVQEGGPAAEAGLKKEEFLLRLNGTPVKQLGLTGIRDCLRQEPGTRVKAVVRGTDGKEREVVLVLKDVL